MTFVKSFTKIQDYPIVLKLRNHNTSFPPQCPICKKPIVKGELFYNRRYFETHVSCVSA